MPSQLFVISAPSGGGKSTIVKALRERMEGLGYSISHTSRKARGPEKDGVEYHFVDRETFTGMVDEEAFAEWAAVYDNFYGTSFSSLNKQLDLGLDVLLDLDVQGAKNIKAHYKDSVLIYLLPPSLDVLEQRLMNRGTDDKTIIRMRLEKASKEISKWPDYDYVIINDDLENAISEARAIIVSERCRVSRRAARLRKLFENRRA